MKVGDLVRHSDGEVGLLLEIDEESKRAVYTHKILFAGHEEPAEFWWYNINYIVEVVSESR